MVILVLIILKSKKCLKINADIVVTFFEMLVGAGVGCMNLGLFPLPTKS